MTYQRINITLPTETLQDLDRFVPKGDSPEETLHERSRFIHVAIQTYISQIQNYRSFLHARHLS